jgi:hypothetical protein
MRSWCGFSGTNYVRDTAQGLEAGKPYRCQCGKEVTLRKAFHMRWIMVPRHKRMEAE